MMQRKKATRSKPVEALKHSGASRSNIPTAETEAFAAETQPVDLLYPRDPSLDPQLVWRGKDEQDREPLKVPAVPIYIQETIEPQAIIEDLRTRTRAADEQPDLFGDAFADLDFEERVEFYRHSGRWTNRMILGDSLMVMGSLAEKEGLKGKVQMIYIDPPYGIKFRSNWQVSTRRRDVKDGKAEDAVRQPEQVRAFRDTWEHGIHSYLPYLRDRLVVARDLLAETGSVFVQIGDENVHLVRSILDEVFGAGNFVSEICFKKTSASNSPMARTNVISGVTDYLIWFAKDREHVKFNALYERREWSPTGEVNYRYVEEPGGHRRQLSPEERAGAALPVGALVFRRSPTDSQTASAESSKAFEFDGVDWHPPRGRGWSTTLAGMSRLAAAGRLIGVGNTLTYVRFWNDFPVTAITNLWSDTVQSGFSEANPYVVHTSQRVIERCLLMTTDPGDLVIDPTCGSGTTAVCAEQWGRRWITVDTSRVALALARTRLMSSRFPYYLLADSKTGAMKESELTGRVSLTDAHKGEIRRGFVYERVPHVTLKSVANNPDIGPGMSRDEVEAVIARSAEYEILIDRPYENRSVVRVSGPFTVESLSPHRRLQTQLADEGVVPDATSRSATQFVVSVLENLRRAGVQNTYKAERLVFESLESHPGVYVQAIGDYNEAAKSRTAAIAIGPEFGTVGKELIREAAKEAVAFGVDVLVVAGFAFEAIVKGEERIGKLVVLKAKINPDLQMPDLLKKTGAGNLFMVFGEPDIDIQMADGMVTVEVRGLDVYDPTTGEIRSNSTDDIACWFIDTNYNGESFFVRHAYFTGADDPYGKLRKALKADIDPEAWASLNSTVSRPFKTPPTGKVAVKVINHYGDEILKVYEVESV